MQWESMTYLSGDLWTTLSTPGQIESATASLTSNSDAGRTSVESISNRSLAKTSESSTNAKFSATLLSRSCQPPRHGETKKKRLATFSVQQLLAVSHLPSPSSTTNA